MDINQLLKGTDCSCGKHHSCDIEYVYIENGAIKNLGEVCKNYKNVLLVADENTFGAAGEKTLAALSGKKVTTVIFSGKKILIPNEEAVFSVTKNLNNSDLIVGVGSGVIQDLCKYVSWNNKIPYMIVATAPSMDGYASSGAAMITDGMKVTYKAWLPRAIIGDTSVLANAPIDMIKSGYGDIIGKFSSLNDWKLAALVNGEYFCRYIYSFVADRINETLSLSEGLLKRSEESVKALMEALVSIGIMISFAGSTQPASGSEHHLSHFFEITGIVWDEEYFPHGIDVAYSTVITAEIREKILAQKFPEKLFREEKNKYTAKIKALYGQVAEGCLDLQKQVGNYEKNRLRVYLEKEDEIKNILREMPSPDKIKQMLLKVGLNISEFYALYGQDKINNCILYAKDLKDRYTVLWLYYDLFGNQ